MKRDCHNAISQVEGLLHAISVMNIDVNVQHSRVVLQQLKDRYHNVVHVAEAACFESATTEVSTSLGEKEKHPSPYPRRIYHELFVQTNSEAFFSTPKMPKVHTTQDTLGLFLSCSRKNKLLFSMVKSATPVDGDITQLIVQFDRSIQGCAGVELTKFEETIEYRTEMCKISRMLCKFKIILFIRSFLLLIE